VKIYTLQNSPEKDLCEKGLCMTFIFHEGAKSGEYWGWGRISKPQSVAAVIATWDV
jgi:hypothetical protein